MNNKKKFLYIFIILFFVPLIIIPLINYIKDDYGIFNRKYANLYSNDVIMNEQCYKLKYLTSKNTPKYDSFILGISQGQAISTHSFPKNQKWYNLSSMTFTPFEYLDTLKYLKKHNINIKNILLVLQPTMFFCTKQDAINDKIKYFMLTDFPYKNSNKLNFYLNYLFLSPSEQNKKNYTIDYIYKINLLYDGSFLGKRDILQKEITHNTIIERPSDLEEYTNISKEMLEEIKKIRNYCKENNINLKIFITPDYYKMYEVYNKNDLKLFKEKLSEITDFYDFSGINHITINEKNYLNFDHFSAYIGDLIIKRIYFQKNFQDFGIYYPKKSRISNIQ